MNKITKSNHQVVEPVVEDVSEGASTASASSKKHGKFNKYFLETCDVKIKDEILCAISKHYGISKESVMEEIYHDEAEHLLDYLTDGTRTATYILMKRRGLF